MSQTFCPTCNSPVDLNSTICSRCQTPLHLAANHPGQTGIVLQDGYVLPAPPSPLGSATGVWQDGAKLVMVKDAQLPDRCVKCNAFTERKMKRNLTWHHPALYLLIIAGVLIYFIVAMILRQSATIYIGICDEHHARHRRNMIITAVLIVSSLLGFVIAIAMNEPMFALLGILLFFGGIVFGVVGTRLVLPAKIDAQYVWLSGINKEYLSALPRQY